MTQKEVAKKLGVTEAAISKWEKGITYPSLPNLVKLGLCFDCSIESLLTYDSVLEAEDIQLIIKHVTNKFEKGESIEANLFLNNLKSKFTKNVENIKEIEKEFKEV